MLASLAISHVVVSRVIGDNVEATMLDEASMVVNLLQVSLEWRESRMKLLSGFPVMRDPTASVESMTPALQMFVSSWPIGDGAVIIDTNGNPVCGTGGLGGIGNVSATGWFSNAQVASIVFTYVSDKKDPAYVYFHKPVLAVSMPLRDSDDQIFHYAVSFTNLADIEKAVDSVKIRGRSRGFLLDEDGVLVAGSLFDDTGRAAPGKADPGMRGLLSLIAGGRSGRGTVRHEGAVYLVAYSAVEPYATQHPEIRWTAGVIISANEAYAPVSRVSLAILALTLLIALLAVIAAILFGRSISRPIEELADSAEEIGSGDLTGDVVIRTRDQVGKLAASFLRMRDSLRSTLTSAGASSDDMSKLADDQSAATRDLFSNSEEIVDSVVVLARNMETQAQKIRKILNYAEELPDDMKSEPIFAEAVRLLEESEILAEAGTSRAVEIASAAQEQRAAVRDVAAGARKLSSMADELKELVKRFKV